MVRGRVAAVLAAGAVAFVAGADDAGAEIDGGCQATVAGVDVAPLSSTDPNDAVEVGAKDVVEVAASSPNDISAYAVDMEFAGFSWQVATDEVDGNSWSDQVEVADYATYGVGLYRVSAVSSGDANCTGSVLIEVTGKSPLTTVAGIGAVVVGAAGVALVASSLVSAGKVGR
jgi:hypothetical protein